MSIQKNGVAWITPVLSSGQIDIIKALFQNGFNLVLVFT